MNKTEVLAIKRAVTALVKAETEAVTAGGLPPSEAQLLRHLAITARHNFASLLKTLTKEELR